MPEQSVAIKAVQEALDTGQVRPSDELPDVLKYMPEKAQLQDQKLKRKYANWLQWLLTVQLVIADAVFVIYAWAGRHWKLDAPVIDVWLGATVVQVVGIVLVVTRHLFPLRDGPKPDSSPA